MRDISLHLMDIAQNSVRANADKIDVAFFIKTKTLYMTIADNGCGMSEELLKKVFDPFTTTRITRNMGMGIPLLNRSCEIAKGKLTIDSTLGAGTTLKASFQIDDMGGLIIGNIGLTMALLMATREDINYTFTIKSDMKAEQFSVSTAQIKQTLGEQISLNNADIIKFITDFINENLKNIFGGALNEIIS